ncbi:MAG: trehalose-6-phosphate synthase [Corynebacterium sp.]|nr:trehalose-6-phosphate synthase [Corynebacterium sp.]
MAAHTGNFVIVANRLPVDLVNGQWVPSPGGLVTGVESVLKSHKGVWVGWPGVADEAPEPFHTEDGTLLHPVALSEDEFQGFYEGFSNATLWPLYHDLIVKPVYDPAWWESYRAVNTRFAEEVSKVAEHGATVWVQDYQLQLVPSILRLLRPDLRIGFFLHIPFPPPEIFRQLPWRDEVLRGILGADLVGFHLTSSASNFMASVDLPTHGEPGVRNAQATVDSPDGRVVGVGAFPISIDPSFEQPDPAEIAALRASIGNPRHMLLGVDRLDYTKGILQRLRAFEELLESRAMDPQDAVFVQIATPSRERVEHYRKTRAMVEEAVGRINGLYGEIGRPVVHYSHRSVNKKRLMTYYAAADIMVVTPFKDGMNLVAKEYVSCHPDGSGAMVLSEFAGAAVELPEAFLCNPHDTEDIKRQLKAAQTELDLYPEAAKERMLTMNRQVREHDVDLWATSFLESINAFVKEQE